MIGANATILPNVVIGDNVIIGAGSVIAKNIPSNSVVVGNPAKIITSVDEYVSRYKVKIDKSKLLGREFTPLSLDDQKKEKLRSLCKDGFAYMMSDNYEEFNK